MDGATVASPALVSRQTIILLPAASYHVYQLLRLRSVRVEIKDELDEIKNLLLAQKKEKVKDTLSTLTEANPSESEKSEDSDSDTNNKPIKEIANTKKRSKHLLKLFLTYKDIDE